ncbi:MAG: hypothetical protein ACRYGK_05830 [Janthinobacterium lividum]
MALEQYKQIIDEFCDLADIDDVASVFETGLLKVGETPVRIEYLQSLDLCRLSIDLGMPLAGYQPGLYRLMLESNFSHIGETLSTLTIEPSSGHAVLVVHVPLARLQSDLPLGFLLGEQLDPIVEAWHALILQVDEESSLHCAQAGQPDGLERYI